MIVNWSGAKELDASVVIDDAETRAFGKSLK